MKKFEFSPKKNTQKLSLTTGLLLLGAAVLMLATMIFGEGMAYRWAIQLLAMGMLVMSIFITTRYIMKSYVYAVIDDGEGDDFTVTEIQGRHVITVCRISLSSVERIYIVEQSDRPTDTEIKKAIKAEKRKMYNYCVDLFSEKYLCVLSNESGTPIAIKLTYDASLEQIFSVEDA